MGQVATGSASKQAAAETLRPSVMLVDDDPGFVRSCARLLSDMGYDVEAAFDGEEAIRLVRERSFDVVMTDLHVPNMDGLQVLRAVQEHDSDVPVVLMTGGPDLESARQAVECGALSYLVKPITTAQLEEIVARAVRLHRAASRRRRILRSSERHTLERRNLQEQLDRSMDGMWIAFQPIVCWSTRTVFAHEALLRTTERVLARPVEILKAAETLDQVHSLGRRIRGYLAGVVAEAQEVRNVFVNLHVLDLEDDDLFDPQSALAAFADRIHFEITERAALERVANVPERIARLRALGYRIAIDDLGEGYAGLTSFAKLEPEIVKLDMSLVRGIDAAPMKKKLVRAMATLCRELGAGMVAEGVETCAERDALLEVGADLLQGFLFAEPAFPAPLPRF